MIVYVFCMVSKGSIHVTYFSVYRLKLFQINFVKMFYTGLKIIESTIKFSYSLA